MTKKELIEELYYIPDGYEIFYELTNKVKMKKILKIYTGGIDDVEELIKINKKEIIRLKKTDEILENARIERIKEALGKNYPFSPVDVIDFVEAKDTKGVKNLLKCCYDIKTKNIAFVQHGHNMLGADFRFKYKGMGIIFYIPINIEMNGNLIFSNVKYKIGLIEDDTITYFKSSYNAYDLLFYINEMVDKEGKK